MLLNPVKSVKSDAAFILVTWDITDITIKMAIEWDMFLWNCHGL